MTRDKGTRTSDESKGQRDKGHGIRVHGLGVFDRKGRNHGVRDKDKGSIITEG